MTEIGQKSAPTGIRAGAAALDWSVGRYECSPAAAQLLPAAQAVIEKAAIGPNERVVDLGCGTGNAALIAAALGAEVTGIDPAKRLLEVAQARAASEGRKVTFKSGNAASIPLEDASADAIVSVFAVIFAPDPGAAAAEMARVLAPGGRIVLSAWIPSGAMFEMTSTAEQAVRRAVGAPEPDRFPWHDKDSLSNLFGSHGFEVEVDRYDLAFTGASAGDFFGADAKNHPAAVAGLGVLESLGQADAVRERLLDIFEKGNEEPERFRITAPYVVATARRHSRASRGEGNPHHQVPRRAPQVRP